MHRLLCSFNIPLQDKAFLSTKSCIPLRKKFRYLFNETPEIAKNSLFTVYSLLFLSGCFIFKKKCDCPKYSESKGIEHRPLPMDHRLFSNANCPSSIVYRALSKP